MEVIPSYFGWCQGATKSQGESVAHLLENGWNTASSEIGNKNGELYAVPSDTRLMKHLKRIYIRPDGARKSVIRIILSDESSLKVVHAAILKYTEIPALGKKVHKKLTDEIGDLYVEYVFLNESFVDERAAASRLLEALKQWVPALNGV